MSAEMSDEVQRGLIAWLRGDAAVTALVPAERIVDHVPQGAEYPYLVLSEMTAVDLSSKTHEASSFTVPVDVYSRWRGGSEARRILRAVHARLHRQLPALGGGFTVITCHASGGRPRGVARLEDGLTYGGQAVFQLYVQQDDAFQL